MLDNAFGEKITLNTHSKLSLVQLDAISSCPVSGYLGKESNPYLAIASLQAVVE